MPRYRIPGVYLEEVAARPPSVTGVETAVAGFVGRAAGGPPEARAALLASYGDYLRVFGPGGGPDGLDQAVRLFFENGGQRAYAAAVAPEAGGGTTAEPVLAAIEALAEAPVQLLAAPAIAGLAGAEAGRARDALLAQCERLGDRFAILSAGRDDDARGALRIRQERDSAVGALYFPWLLVADPAGAGTLAVPPEGALAGIYARVDAGRGVHKAPANEALRGIAGLARAVTPGEQELLNPAGVNCLRRFPGRGDLVWGARTMSGDAEWKYVNVRRLAIFLERSLDAGLAWAVFEPNAEPLWLRVRQAAEAFLYEQWRAGALQGAKPEQGFFVRCDRSTMTQADIEAGRLICLVGFAPVKPAEFVIFRIGKNTAEAAG